MMRSFAFGILLIMGSAVNAAEPCKGQLFDHRTGSDAVLTWRSLAYPEAVNEYCFERAVETKRRVLVNWPSANMINVLVDRKLLTRSCCYAGAHAEDVLLEYGVEPVKVGTKVIRGEGEPASQTSQAKTFRFSIEGNIIIDGVGVAVDISCVSTVDLGVKNLRCVNRGDTVTIFVRDEGPGGEKVSVVQKDFSAAFNIFMVKTVEAGSAAGGFALSIGQPNGKTRVYLANTLRR
jgi:hypothetical protein